MSSVLAWVEFNEPVYVGEAGYIRKLYIGHSRGNPESAVVCEKATFKDSGFEFDLGRETYVSVPVSNVRYTYSTKEMPKTPAHSWRGMHIANGAGRDTPPPLDETVRSEFPLNHKGILADASPKRRGRPPKPKP